MAKKKSSDGCCDFRYLNSVTTKDAYPIPRIDISLSKLGDVQTFTTLALGSAFGRYHRGNRIWTRRVLHASWDCYKGKGCHLAFAMRQPPSND